MQFGKTNKNNQNYLKTSNNSQSKEKPYTCDNTSEENEEVVVFRPIPREKMRPSPVEIAVKESRKIAFYIPTEEFKESALFVLDWAMERLQKSDPSISKPDYEFVVGEKAPDWDGKLDKEGRVIIHHSGRARFG